MKIRSNFNILVSQEVIITLLDKVQEASESMSSALSLLMVASAVKGLDSFRKTVEKDGYFMNIEAIKNSEGMISVDIIFTFDMEDEMLLAKILEHQGEVLRQIEAVKKMKAE